MAKPQATINLKVKGMHCTSCEVLIKEGLEEKGAANVKVDWKKGIVIFSGIDEKTAKAVIVQEGYSV
jgi:copper chaperone CopZ